MAAGLGFKTFTTGEVLTAADTNGYLMQGVLVFASSAARASAITSPQEGQYSYLKDTDALEYYSGSAWVGAPVGDITGVTAGTGISGGGTSGTVTVTNSMATEITAAGDIIVGTGSGTFDNLPIGTTAQVLTADTTVSPYKVKWATPAISSSGLTLVGSSDFTTSSAVNINNCFSATYLNYVFLIDLTAASGNAGISMKLRASGTDASTNYNNNRLYISGSSSTASESLGATSNDIGEIATAYPTLFSLEAYLYSPFIAQATSGFSRCRFANVNASRFGDFRFYDHTTATSYDGFSVIPSTGTITGKIRVYGYSLT